MFLLLELHVLRKNGFFNCFLRLRNISKGSKKSVLLETLSVKHSILTFCILQGFFVISKSAQLGTRNRL